MQTNTNKGRASVLLIFTTYNSNSQIVCIVFEQFIYSEIGNQPLHIPVLCICITVDSI